MALEVEIDCISRAGQQGSDRYLSHVGGPKPNGSGRWLLSEPDAIVGIDRGNWDFYVERDGRLLAVVIARDSAGNRFLKTAADGQRPDALLALPQCSVLPPWQRRRSGLGGRVGDERRHQLINGELVQLLGAR